MDDVLDSVQAAQLLKVSKNTLLKLAQEGKVPGQKVGHQWRFSRLALVKWLENGQVKKNE